MRFIAGVDRLEGRDLQAVIHPAVESARLNPQPLPPAVESARLNPQPLPPELSRGGRGIIIVGG